MDRTTRGTGYFLLQFKLECEKILKGYVAGDYAATLEKLVRIITEDMDRVIDEEEKKKRPK